ncbi:hypothetical protein BIW11_10776, partial [Tropilaelaps mercedesae]
KFLGPPKDKFEEREAMQKSLIDLRNNICSAYFMLNALYILALFFLQINKDSLFMEWPFGGNHTIEFVPNTNFLGMLLHRLETFKYILAVATVGENDTPPGQRKTTLEGESSALSY